MKLYWILRHVMRIAAHLYFVDIQTSGCENLPQKGPVILAANHPGSVLDTILLSTQIAREIAYLAKSDLFRFPFVATMFNNLGVIPVYRPGHEPSHSERNLQIFERVYQVLEHQGCIGIFPEGRNSPQRQVAELRTGAARIALGAEALHNYQLGLNIVPVGVSYESRELFLSSVLLNFEQPIRIADYAELHQKNPDQAVRSLTSDLQQALRRQTLHIEDLRWSQLIADLSDIFRQEPGVMQNGNDFSPRAAEQDKTLKTYWQKLCSWFRPAAQSQNNLKYFLRTRQKINTILARMAEKEPDSIQDLHKDIERYKAHLSQARLRKDLSHSFDKPVQERLIRLRMTLYAVFMAPFALVGFVHNILPYLITLFTARLFQEEPIRGFAYFAIGIFVFSLTYLCYGLLFWHFVLSSVPWCLAYLGLLLWTGFACLRYRRTIMRYRDKILVRTFFQTQKHLSQSLQQERQAIISRFQELQKQFRSG